MSKILLIGNSGSKNFGTDGQTVKVRLYLKKIKDEGFDVSFVDLENFTKKPFRTLFLIKKRYNECDRVVLITAERGAKILIPFINFINRKHNKPFVFPLIGISVLHSSIDKLSEEEKNNFLVNDDYHLCKPRKSLVKQLKKISYILPETELLTKVFAEFYGLNNIRQLNNFREVTQIEKQSVDISGLRLVYVSRVMPIKGIFDLLSVVKQLNKEGFEIFLDIYGDKYLSHEDNIRFNSFLDEKYISYKGIVRHENVVETISNYDLFVFPTKYYGEGTPGVIVESLISGTPIISSDFPQAKFLLKKNFDTLFYKMADSQGLKDTIASVARNKEILNNLKTNTLFSGQKYTYNYERKVFLKYICGVEED